MPFKRKHPELVITQSSRPIERAKMILEYSKGVTISAIARQLSTNRPKAERCIDKALQLGALTALNDIPRPRKPPEITTEAKALACKLSLPKAKRIRLLLQFIEKQAFG